MKYLAFKSICLVSFFLVLGTGPLSAGEDPAQPIEIFVGGKKYKSLEGYHEEEKMNEDLARQKTAKQENVSEVRQMFDETLRTSPNSLNLKFDPNKMKTIYIKEPVFNPPPSYSADFLTSKDVPHKDPFTHSYTTLNRLGFDQGIHKVISDFTLREKKWKGQAIDSADLERVLRDSFGESTRPLLLISDKGKLRVMELDSQDQDGDRSLGQ
jgi:hypothetical protein